MYLGYKRGEQVFLNDEDKKKRTDICDRCPFKKDIECTDCGCYISPKARMLHSECGQGKWKNLNININKYKKKNKCMN